jgi:hypothetical protein
VSSLIEWVSRPLAWSFVVVVDEATWGPIFDYIAFTRQLEVEFDGRVYVAYGNDWRRLPVGTWLDLMSEREHSGGTGPPPASRLRPPRWTGRASPPRSGPRCPTCADLTGWPPAR